MNAAAHKEGSESPPLTTFAFRCKSAEARDALMAAINAHKGQVRQLLSSRQLRLFSQACAIC